MDIKKENKDIELINNNNETVYEPIKIKDEINKITIIYTNSEKQYKKLKMILKINLKTN